MEIEAARAARTKRMKVLLIGWRKWRYAQPQGAVPGRVVMNACLATALLLSIATNDKPVCQKPPRIILAQGSMSCGLPPLPPLGCRVGSCVCNQFGQNCQWQFVCN